MSTNPEFSQTSPPPTSAKYQVAKLTTDEPKVNTAPSHQRMRTVVSSTVEGSVSLRYIPRDPRITEINTVS